MALDMPIDLKLNPGSAQEIIVSNFNDLDSSEGLVSTSLLDPFDLLTSALSDQLNVFYFINRRLGLLTFAIKLSIGSYNLLTCKNQVLRSRDAIDGWRFITLRIRIILCTHIYYY